MNRKITFSATRWGTLAAGTVLTALAVRAAPAPGALLLAVFAVVCLAAESGNITLPYSGSVSFGAVATLPAILFVGGGYAALCGAVGQFLIHLRHRRPVPTLIFNASQRAVSLVLAGVAWSWIGTGRASFATAGAVLAPERVIAAALGCILVYVVATHVLVSLYSATRRGVPVWTVLSGNAALRFAATGTLGSFGLLFAMIALRIATMPDDIEYVLLFPAIAGVVYLIYDAHRQTNRQLHQLYSAVTDLVQAVDLDQLLQRLAGMLDRVATPAGLWVALRDGGGRVAVVVSRGVEATAAQRLADTLTRDVWGPHPDVSVQLTRVSDYAHDRPDALLACGEPVRSVMLVPLAAGPDLVGVLGMIHPIADYFIPAQEQAVAMLAAETAFVVNYLRLYRESQQNLSRAEALQTRNAELLRDSQRRAHQLALLNRAFMRVASSLAADDVFAALVDELHSSLGYPRVGLRLLEGDTLRLAAERGYTGAAERMRITEGVVGRVARTGQPALVLDVRRDPDFVPSHPMVTQLASAPISHRGVVTGVITIESVEPVLASADLELLTTLAGYAALAIENARNYEEARTLATTDGLTGLPNRRMLWDALERELARAIRYKAPLSVIMVEIDHFKRYNDTHGHLRGDEALQQVARLLAQAHRANVDVVARYGGDEFVTLLPQTGKAAAAAVAERIRRAVVSAGLRGPAGADVTSGALALLTVSLGVATFPEDGRSIEALLRAADRSMYDVKASGGDAVAVAPGSPAGAER
ncbi:MAG TPA: diguanylate cyclase [bacterium]|nr:diguanylate cyclase [bacterium]